MDQGPYRQPDENGWFVLAHAQLGTAGYLFSPELPGRTDLCGIVVERDDKSRYASCYSAQQCRTFTHWHPMLKPPITESR